MQFMKQQKVLPDIQVEVTSHYLPEQSNPEDSRYVFAYHVTISNHGSQAAQLLSRHWIITDAHRQVQEVRGEGVIGEKPTIEPGASYDYTSGCVLATEVGTMEGSYQMRADDGSLFDAEIPRFVLSFPRTLH